MSQKYSSVTPHDKCSPGRVPPLQEVDASKRQIDVILKEPTIEEEGTSTCTVSKEKCTRMEGKPLISFRGEEANDNTQDNPLSILIRISIAQVKRVMVDIGSIVDVLFVDAFQKLGLTWSDICPMTISLTEFMGNSVLSLRMITLHATFGEEPQDKTLPIKFIMIGTS